MASAAIPAVLPTVSWEGRELMDRGVGTTRRSPRHRVGRERVLRPADRECLRVDEGARRRPRWRCTRFACSGAPDDRRHRAPQGRRQLVVLPPPCRLSVQRIHSVRAAADGSHVRRRMRLPRSSRRRAAADPHADARPRRQRVNPASLCGRGARLGLAEEDLGVDASAAALRSASRRQSCRRSTNAGRAGDEHVVVAQRSLEQREEQRRDPAARRRPGGARQRGDEAKLRVLCLPARPSRSRSGRSTSVRAERNEGLRRPL